MEIKCQCGGGGMPTTADRRAFEANEREIRRRLARHHLTLAMGVTGVVDTRPPTCMYSSPKSIHYKPHVTKRSQSVENLRHSSNRQSKSNATLSNRTFDSCYNIHAAAPNKSSTLQSQGHSPKNRQRIFPSGAYGRWLSSVKSRIRDSPNYHPPSKRKSVTSSKSFSSDDGSIRSSEAESSASRQNSRDTKVTSKLPPISPSLSNQNQISMASDGYSSSLNRQENHRRHNNGQAHMMKRKEQVKSDLSPHEPDSTDDSKDDLYKSNANAPSLQINYEALDDEYLCFKERALNMVLLRGIFSEIVIEDCFRRQMRKHAQLDTHEMERVMRDTMRELSLTGDTKSGGRPIEKSSSVRNLHSSLSNVSMAPLQHNPEQPPVTGRNEVESVVKPVERLGLAAVDSSRRALLTGNSFSFDDSYSFPLDAPPPAISFNTSIDEESY